MIRLLIVFIIIISIGVIQPLNLIPYLRENFVVQNNPHTYNWYQGSTNPTHVYSGTQLGDSHLFNKSGQYVKEIDIHVTRWK